MTTRGAYARADATVESQTHSEHNQLQCKPTATSANQCNRLWTVTEQDQNMNRTLQTAPATAMLKNTHRFKPPIHACPVEPL